MPLSLRESIARSQELPRSDVVLMGRAQLLEQADRDLVEAVLVRGQPASLIARMMGVGPRIVRTRVKRLGRRLVSQRFLDAARALAYLEADDVTLARLRFCGGLNLDALSQRLNVPIYTLRRRLDRISAQIVVIHRLTRAAACLRPCQN